MWLLMLFGWVWTCLGTVDSNSTFGKVGGDVVLTPSTVSDTITGVLWYCGPNFAAEWMGGKTTFYGNFKSRSALNQLTGELTIRQLTLIDSNNYTAEINRNQQSPIKLTVLESVKEPTISVKSGENDYVLSCDGAIKDAEPVTYSWSSNDVTLPGSAKEITVSKTNCSKFRCTMQNPVSKMTSGAKNPCDNNGIAVGLSVGLGLLALLMVVIIAHRIKTKEWFYQKDATCWKADFWTDTKTQAADGNGARPGENRPMVDK